MSLSGGQISEGQSWGVSLCFRVFRKCWQWLCPLGGQTPTGQHSRIRRPVQYKSRDQNQSARWTEGEIPAVILFFIKSIKPVSETGVISVTLHFVRGHIQCLLDIQTLDKAAALPIAAATRVTDLCQYINSNLAYSNLKFLVLCTN